MKAKVSILLIFFFFPIILIAQQTINKKIIDEKNRLPIAYANILNINTKEGVLSNIDGDFKIHISSLEDTIRMSYLGYKTKYIRVDELLHLHHVSIAPEEFQLHEIEIHSSQDYIFDILKQCRKTMKKDSKHRESKAYFKLYSTLNDTTSEFLEIYYNTDQKGVQIHDLFLKNGRGVLYPLNGLLFQNLNTSQIFKIIDIFHEDKYIPTAILQLNKSKMQRIYNVSCEFLGSEMYKISFTPKKNTNEVFAGTVWIDKHTFCIKQLNLFIDNATRHPFELFYDNQFSDIDFEVNYTFRDYKNETVLDHIVFTLDMQYNCRNFDDVLFSEKSSKRLIVNSLIYLYDYEKPFILPYFEYDNTRSDYSKLWLIPYNPVFWESSQLLLSNKEIKQLDKADTSNVVKEQMMHVEFDSLALSTTTSKHQALLTHDKSLFNRNNSKYVSDYWFWSAKKRVLFTERFIARHKKILKNPMHQTVSDMYKIAVQILLDIVPENDTYNCASYTVLDTPHTFYNPNKDNYTDIFVNIYMDICEIERQKMEESLSQHNHSLQDIDSVYNACLQSIDSVTNEYLNQVKRGQDLEQLRWWNRYVKLHLGIDNIKLFTLKAIHQ